MKLRTDQRNYVIVALCAVLIVMGVGYAAFSSLLTINGTANISNSWNIKITNIRAINPCTAREREETAQAEIESKPQLLSATVDNAKIKQLADLDYYNCPSEAYDITAPTHTDTTATFSTGLIKPGDERVYEVEVKNLGSINAEVTKTLTNNVNSDAIVFSYDGVSETPSQIISENDEYNKQNLDTTEPFELNSGGTKYIYIKVGYDSSVTSQPNNLTASITVELNATQKVENSQSSGGSQEPREKITGTIYRWNNSQITIGDPIVPESRTEWCIFGDISGNKANSCDNFGMRWDTENECITFMQENQQLLEQYQVSNPTCDQRTITIEGIGEYTTDASTLNKTYYLKHDVVDDIITASYVCFVYNNAEHCMKGGDNGASFTANTGMIQDFQTFYNLPNNANPGCNFNSSNSICDGGGFHQVSARSNGHVRVSGSSSEHCGVYSEGNSYCSE